MSNERAAFEAHIDDCIASAVGFAQAIERDGFGDYKTDWVASRWSTWQASRNVAIDEALAVSNQLDIESFGVLPIRASIIINAYIEKIRELK